MENDAIAIGVDNLVIKWHKSKKMRLYIVAIVADNLGKLVVTEPPASKPIRLRKGVPYHWPFAGDGYDVYHRTGSLPDVISGHLMLIQDRGVARKPGEIIHAISSSEEAKSVIDAAARTVKQFGAGFMPSLVGSALNVIGGYLSNRKDKVLETVSGSLKLTARRRQMTDLTQTLPEGSGYPVQTRLDVLLWDAQADRDTTADTHAAVLRTTASGLLFTNEPESTPDLENCGSPRRWLD